MNSKMRHTAHLLVGRELTEAAPFLKQYTLMYGAGDACDYLQIFSCDKDSEGGFRIQDYVQKPIQEETTFSSGISYRYHVESGQSQTLANAAQLQRYFVELFNRTVTIDNPGETGKLNLCLYLPLYDESCWSMALQLIAAIRKSGKPYLIDVMGLPGVLAPLLVTDEAAKAQIPDQMEHYNDICRKVAREVIAHAEVHRLLLFEDSNTQGLALNLDREGLLRILGEFALLAVEHYPAIFPANQFGQEIDVTTFGISMLAFDKIYFVDYLLHNAYLEILGRERVDETKVNVNEASDTALRLLSRHIGLYKEFEHDRVDPKIAEANARGALSLSETQQLEKELQQRIDAAIIDMQSFIGDERLSLPHKQAIMAQLLGEDDALLQGIQYHKEQPTLDDCDAETINLFIAEDNKQVRIEEATADQPRRVHRGVLTTPTDSNEHIYLPLDEMKLLRAQIRQRTAFIRKKQEELDQIKVQVKTVEDSQKRLSDGGFNFEGQIFRLMPTDNEVHLFEETYVHKQTNERSVDLRSDFTTPKNQGELGTCTAFAMVSIFEYIMKKANPSNPDLSEMFVFYNAVKKKSLNWEEKLKEGTSFFDAFSAMSSLGVCTEDLCPYGKNLLEPSPEAYEDGKSRLVKTVKNVNISHEDFTSAISEGYPIAISLRIFDSFQADGNGFIYRPTDEQIKNHDDGNHAMVICGFSEDEKVYIVRNSWGTSFGDKGYCYIPFSYIDDPALCNQACIITDVDVTEQVKVSGIDKRKTVSFNLTDDNIRSSILHILIDSENRLLMQDNARYTSLRFSYEQLLQTLSNPSKRDLIFQQSVARLESEIATQKEAYQTFVSETRPNELKEFKRVRRKWLFWGAFAILIFLLDVWLMFYLNWTKAATITSVITGILILLYILGVWYGQHLLNKLKEELDDKAAAIKSRIAHAEQEKAEKHLRLHLAGMVVSSLTDIKIKLINKYHALADYVSDLGKWSQEEQQTLKQMTVPSRTPCIQLLNNAVLDAYFDKHKLDITGGLHLYDLVDNYKMSQDDILKFKIQIRDKVIDQLRNEYRDFSLVEYLTDKTHYPYLSDKASDIAKLMPLLDKRSDCFLHIVQTGVTLDETLEKSVFIHTDSQADRNVWRETYQRYFNTRPADLDLDSRYKLIELQIQNLKLDQVAILN